MIVVSDTTPLISLLKIHRLDLLKGLFDEVQIPQAVFNELTENQDFPDEAEEIKSCDFIHIQNVESSEVSLFRRATGLDLGESEAFVLTDKIKADLVLVDEAHARKIARTIGFNIMGTIGILTESFKNGFISADELQSAVEIFRTSGRFISEDLLKKLLDLI